jgi:hypothetical protein
MNYLEFSPMYVNNMNDRYMRIDQTQVRVNPGKSRGLIVSMPSYCKSDRCAMVVATDCLDS